MAKAKADPYDAERLASKGLLPDTEVKPKPSRTTTARKKVERSPAEPKPASEGAELPRRNRKARALKARHFRLPIDIDEKLKDLLKFYDDSTMVWVVCKLIQEDWVRTRRELRRRTSDPAADRPADAAAAEDSASTTKDG
jgi:hypothetical protein